MQQADILVLTAGSVSGMISLMQRSTVLVIVYAFNARNPSYKSLVYFTGVSTFEYVPLDSALVWPAIPHSDPCSNASVGLCHWTRECHWAFH